MEEVLGLYRDSYFDLNMRHFHELREEHGIELSYTFVQKALHGAELVARGRKRPKHGDDESGIRCQECCCTLTVANTTAEIYHRQEESTRPVMKTLEDGD